MNYEVFVTQDAEDDIFSIFIYVLENDSENSANYVFQKLKETCLSLLSLPDRGHTPPELERINVYNYKEIHFKPYRIIYQIVDNKVYILCVFDGRRELQEVLENRLFR
jgi:toxin ParE1/3/4